MLAMGIAKKGFKPLPSGTPADLHRLVERCLIKEKTTRPTSEELLHTEPISLWAERARAAAPQTPPPSPFTPDVRADRPEATVHSSSGLAEAHLGFNSDMMGTASPTVLPNGMPLAATTDQLPAPPLNGAKPIPPPLTHTTSDSSSYSSSLAATIVAVPCGLRQLYQSRGGVASDPHWQLVDALVGHEV